MSSVRDKSALKLKGSVILVLSTPLRPWLVCFSAFVGLTFCYATLGSLTFGLLIPPLSDEFGWTRTEISLGLTFYTVAFVFFSYPIGILMDRFGVRPVLLVSISAFAMVMYAMRFLSGSLLQFYVMYALLGIVGVGTIPSGYTRIILNWFDRYRGVALAIALSGVGVGVTIIPLVNHLILSVDNWQGVYLFYSSALLFLCLPVVVFGLKEQPQSKIERTYLKNARKMSMRSAGTSVAKKSTIAGRSIVASGFTLRSAFRDPIFLLIVASFTLLGFLSIGVITHVVPALVAKSFSGEKIATVMSLYGISIIVGRLLCGPLLDRYHAPYVAALFIVAMAAGIALMGVVWFGYIGLLVGIFLFGLGGGAEFDFMSYLISCYMGLKAYGKLYGITFAGFYAGGATGAWAVGAIADVAGGYVSSFFVTVVMAIVAAAILSRLGHYRT